MPAHVRFVIVDAGVHGLSTAWHLVSRLRATGTSDGSDVLVLDRIGRSARYRTGDLHPVSNSPLPWS